MNKKSVSATILILFLALFFSVVGVCFTVFVYNETKILISDVYLSADSGIVLAYNKDLTDSADKLKLSKMDVGLKPATGDVDADTQIPSTITDEGTSEGYYATIYVKSDANFKVVVKDIKIQSKKDELLVKEERKNIFVSIKDIKNSTNSLEKDNIELALFENSNKTEKLTFYIWLSAFSGEDLEGAKIAFNIQFIKV